MRTITIHVSEETYQAFQEHAADTDTSASELIRTAMEEYYRANFAKIGSIFDAEPADAGRVLRPLSADNDLLEEMLG